MTANTVRFVLGAMVAASLVGCGSSEPEAALTPSSPTASAPAEEAKPATDAMGGTVAETSTPPAATTQEPKLKGPKVVVSLDGGKSFTLQLDGEGTPKSAAGIADLVKAKFYDGTRVHRIEPGFCVQWGDPYSKNGVSDPRVGSGGSGKPLPFEAGKLSFKPGTIGVASKGAGTGGDGQIFVTTGDATFLDGDYAAIGRVTQGMEVIEGIQIGDKVVSMKIVE